MKKFVMVLIATFGFSAASLANFKAGYIDMQKAIQSTSAGKKARKDLEKEFEKKKSGLQAKEANLKKKMEAFEKKKMVLSEKKRAEQQRDLQQQMLKFREELQKSRLSMQQKEIEVTKPILKKMQTIIGDVAKSKGLSMVFERNQDSVMWANTNLDITDAVVKKYNKN